MVYPLLIAAAGAYYVVNKNDSWTDQQKELHRLYEVEIARGNYNVFLDLKDNTFIDYKNHEVYYMDQANGKKLAVRAYVNDQLQPIQRNYLADTGYINWLDIRNMGRPAENVGKPLDINNPKERVDIFTTGLLTPITNVFSPQRGGIYSWNEQSDDMSPGELYKKIQSNQRQFEERSAGIREKQQVIIDKIADTISKIPQETRDQLYTHLPAEDKLAKFNDEFKKMTGAELPKDNPKDAFIIASTSLNANIDQPIVTSVLSPEFVQAIKQYQRDVSKDTCAAKVQENLQAGIASIMDPKKDGTTAPNPDKPNSTTDFSVDSVVKWIKQNPGTAIIAGLLTMCGGGWLVSKMTGIPQFITSSVGAVGGGALALAGAAAFFKFDGPLDKIAEMLGGHPEKDDGKTETKSTASVSQNPEVARTASVDVSKILDTPETVSTPQTEAAKDAAKAEVLAEAKGPANPADQLAASLALVQMVQDKAAKRNASPSTMTQLNGTINAQLVQSDRQLAAGGERTV